jgi:hypothetical protein
MWLRRHRNDIIVFVIMTVGVVRGYGSRRGSDIIVRIIIGRDVAPRFYIIRCCRCHSVGCGVSGELMLCIELPTYLSLQASELRMKNFAGSFPQHLMHVRLVLGRGYGWLGLLCSFVRFYGDTSDDGYICCGLGIPHDNAFRTRRIMQ